MRRHMFLTGQYVKITDSMLNLDLEQFRTCDDVTLDRVQSLILRSSARLRPVCENYFQAKFIKVKLCDLAKLACKMETSRQLSIIQFYQKKPNRKHLARDFNRIEEEDKLCRLSIVYLENTFMLNDFAEIF